MAERQPSKLNVAGSRPVSRSTPPRTIDQRRRRLAVARAATRIELILGTIGVLLTLFMVIAAPKYSTPMLSDNPLTLPFVIAVVGALVGYAWMLRIRFADPERGRPFWRYRSPTA